MAGLLRQLHQLCIGLVAQVGHQGDALLQVQLQRQQAAVALVSPQHRCMHPLQQPATSMGPRASSCPAGVQGGRAGGRVDRRSSTASKCRPWDHGVPQEVQLALTVSQQA